MRLFLALLIGTTLLFAAPVPKEKPKIKDDDAILANWKVETFDLAGSKDAPPKDMLDKLQFVFAKDNVFKMIVGDREMKGTFKLDSTAEPKTADMVMDEDKTATMQCLYELDGSTLKLAMPKNPKSPRPKEFKSDGKDIAIITFKRVKADDKKDK